MKYLLLILVTLCGQISLFSQSAQDSYAKGNDAYQDKQYLQAVSYYTSAIDNNYTPIEQALDARSVAEYALKQYEEAIKDANEALKHDYNRAQPYYIKALCLTELGQYGEALVQFDRGERLDRTVTWHLVAKKIAQEKNKLPLREKIKNYVTVRIEAWQVKGKFEKTKDYQVRVNETTRNEKIKALTDEAIGIYKSEYAELIDWKDFHISQYDADNETYLINSSKYGNFALVVPIADAPNFELNWATVAFSKPDFYIQNDAFILCKFTVENTKTSKKYTYNNQQSSTYNYKSIEYNFKPIEVDVPSTTVENKTQITNSKISVGSADVDVNIPLTNKKKPDAYVLAIGNEDYSSYQMSLDKEANVPFAMKDAEVFAKYCEKTLGIPSSNISVLKNATLGQMGQAISKLEKLAEIGKGNAELIFYYAGHGLPNEETKEGYLIPVDVSGSNVTSGIRLNELYSRLGKFSTKKVTVFLDACFSGGSREGQLVALRSVRIKPKEETVANNMVVFTSSSGTESSAAYKEKGHGMFTYFLLKKLMDSKGEATYKELGDYLQQQVLKQSVLTNSKEQTPQVKTAYIDASIWSGWKF